MAYDVAPLDTLDEKERILDQAVREGWTIFFEHDTETATAGIERGERGYAAVDRLTSL
jgi:hypothetical protein